MYVLLEGKRQGKTGNGHAVRNGTDSMKKELEKNALGAWPIGR